MTKTKQKASAPIVRKKRSNTIARSCPFENTIEVTDPNGRTRIIAARSIRDALRIEGDKG